MAATAWSLADVEFDPKTHTSRLPGGADVPHVTAVLSAVGVSVDFESLAASSRRMGQAVALAGARGTAVHADCHAYDDGDLDWEDVDARVRPFVEAWAVARENLGLVPLVRERRLFHPQLIYTGIMDGVFEVGRRRVLVDIKTGDPESAAAQYQTAAYEGAYCAGGGLPVDERWAVQLLPGRRVPYAVTSYSLSHEAARDFPHWVAMLTTYRLQAGRRARRT